VIDVLLSFDGDVVVRSRESVEQALAIKERPTSNAMTTLVTV